MDGARLHDLVHKGYGIAARNVGLTYDVFRPLDIMAPLAGPAITSGFKASFQPYKSSFSWRWQSSHHEALRDGLLDARELQHGDYFVGSDGTYALISIGHANPPVCIACNRTVGVYKPSTSAPLGLGPYSGQTAANEVAVMAGWPMSMRKERSAAPMGRLPGSDGASGTEVLLPCRWPAVVIEPGFILRDDLDQRHVVSAVELTDLGWRIGATQAVT